MANATIQFTQGVTVGGAGQSVLGFTANTSVTMTDAGGPGATSYQWQFVSWPASLSTPPTITNATSQVATVNVPGGGFLDGSYIVKLTRTEGAVVTVDIRFFGVADEDGLVLPSAGQTGNMSNIGGSQVLAQQAGWAGRADASTNAQLDAYLRFIKSRVGRYEGIPQRITFTASSPSTVTYQDGTDKPYRILSLTGAGLYTEELATALGQGKKVRYLVTLASTSGGFVLHDGVSGPSIFAMAAPSGGNATYEVEAVYEGSHWHLAGVSPIAALNGNVVQTDGQKVLFGLIDDHNVAFGAGISGGKISPDFGAQTIVTSGEIHGGSLKIDATSANQYLKTDGSNNVVSVPHVEVGDLHLAGQTRGDILFFNGSSWARLGAGTTGQLLQTNGTSADPVWVTSSGGGGTLMGDVVGSSTSNVVDTLTGTGNIVTVATGTVLDFNGTGTLSSPTTTPLFLVQPVDTAKAPFGLFLQTAHFNSTWDNMFALGYNYLGEIPSEPRVAWTIEQDYEVSPGTHVVETYLEIRNDDASKLLRPFYAATDRTSYACNPQVQFGYGAHDAFLIVDSAQAAYASFGYDGVSVGKASIGTTLTGATITGTAGGNISLASSAGYAQLAGLGNIYLDANTIHFRASGAASVFAQFDSTGQSFYAGGTLLGDFELSGGFWLVNVPLGYRISSVGAQLHDSGSTMTFRGTSITLDDAAGANHYGQFDSSGQTFYGSGATLGTTTTNGNTEWAFTHSSTRAGIALYTNASVSNSYLYFASKATGGAVYLDTTQMFLRDGGAGLVLTASLAGAGASSWAVAEPVSFSWVQTARTSDAATHDFLFQPQRAFSTATGTNRTPGNFVVDVGAPTNSGTGEAALIVKRNGAFCASIGPNQGNGAAFSAIYLGLSGFVPAQTNFAFLSDGTATTYVNAFSGGTLYLSNGGNGNNVGSIGLTTTSFAVSAASSNYAIKQAAQTSDVATTTLIVSAQNAYSSAVTNTTGGTLDLRSGINTDGTTYSELAVTPTTVQTTIGGIVAGTQSLLSNTWFFTANASRNGIGFLANGASQYIQFQAIGGSGIVYFDTGSVHFRDTSQVDALTLVVTSGGSCQIKFAETCNDTNLTQAPRSSDATAHNMLVAASSAWPSAVTHTTGGSLTMQSGTNTDGTTISQIIMQPSEIDFTVAGTSAGKFTMNGSLWQIVATTATTGLSFVCSSSSQVIRFNASTASSSIQLISSNTYFQDASGNTTITWNVSALAASSMELAKTTTMSWTQDAQTSDTACFDLVFQPQRAFASATGTHRTPGFFVVDVGAPTNSSTIEAGFQIKRAGVLQAQIGNYFSGSGVAIWLGAGITPTSQNFAFLGDNSTEVFLNTVLGGTVYLATNGTSANGIGVTANTVYFYEGQASGVYGIAPRTSDTAVNAVTVTGQNAYGLASTNTTGGSLFLQSGVNTDGVTQGSVTIAPSVIGMGVSGSTILRVLSTGLAFDKAVTNPVINQAAPTTDVATQTVTLAGQSAWASASTHTTGGNLSLQSGANSNGTTFSQIGMSPTSISGILSGTTYWNTTGNSTKFTLAMATEWVTPTYSSGTGFSIDASLGNNFKLVPTDNVAFTIANPTNGTHGQHIYFRLTKVSGAMGAVTFGTKYKLSQGNAPVAPGSGSTSTSEFVYHSGDDLWIQVGQAANDVAN
jgi:hypothetical protein